MKFLSLTGLQYFYTKIVLYIQNFLNIPISNNKLLTVHDNLLEWFSPSTEMLSNDTALVTANKLCSLYIGENVHNNTYQNILRIQFFNNKLYISLYPKNIISGEIYMSADEAIEAFTNLLINIIPDDYNSGEADKNLVIDSCLAIYADGIPEYFTSTQFLNVNSYYNLITLEIIPGDVYYLSDKNFNIQLTKQSKYMGGMLQQYDSNGPMCTFIKTLDLREYDISLVTSMIFAFFMYQNAIGISTVTDIKLPIIDNITDISYMFAYVNSNTIDVSSINMSKVLNILYMITTLFTETIILGDFDISHISAENQQFWLYCSMVKNIIGNVKGIKSSVLLGNCPTVESVMVIFNGLDTITDTQAVGIGEYTYNKLTDEQIAIATSKGWTVEIVNQ